MVKADMSMLVVRRLVEEVMGEALQEREMWYGVKYDRGALLPLQKDVDLKKLLKGNDDDAYIYVGGEERAVMQRLHESDVGRGCLQDGISGASNGKRNGGGGRGGEDDVKGGTIGRGGRSATANRYGL